MSCGVREGTSPVQCFLVCTHAPLDSKEAADKYWQQNSQLKELVTGIHPGARAVHDQQDMRLVTTAGKMEVSSVLSSLWGKFVAGGLIKQSFIISGRVREMAAGRVGNYLFISSQELINFDTAKQLTLKAEKKNMSETRLESKGSIHIFLWE